MVEVIIHKRNRTIINMNEFMEAFSKVKDGKVLVSFKDIRIRSIPQNSYYWAVVVPMVRKGLYEIGFDEVQTNEDAHELMKKQFIRREFVNKQTGEIVKITGHTADLTIPEFNEYIERVCRWSSEYLSVVIPAPNEPMAEFEEWEKGVVMVAEYDQEVNATVIEKG